MLRFRNAHLGLPAAIAGAIALTCAAAAPVSAGVPWPSASTFDSCLVWCPAGDVVYHLTERQLSGIPFPGAVATWDLGDCAGFAPCPLDGSEPYELVTFGTDRTVRVFANSATGVANFPVKSGGVCASATLSVNGVIFITLPLASPDLNGDGFVDGTDRGQMLGLIGTNEPTADLNCDGTVTSADLAILMEHYGHACAGGATPARRGTWGEVKTIYR